MPYKCVHCSSLYMDDAREVFEGCASCKSKFFFYLKDEKLKDIMKNKEEVSLTSLEKKQIEKDVREIAGVKDEEVPIFLDFESIKILKPGKYLLDLQKLFASDKPKVYQIEDGKYIIDLTSAMKLPFSLKK
ncbi:MAG: Zn-ribbon containing protein [Candidatus Pacearchaeota archaeon]